MYTDVDYAQSRLINTLVRHQGKAVLVESIGGEFTCYVRNISTDKAYEVNMDDLDLKSPPLGFVNKDGECLYLVRSPMRNDWRQGVRTNSVHSLSRAGRGRVNLETIALCMDGVYPSKSAALRRLREGWTEVALSRDFSLRRRGSKTCIRYKWYGDIGKATSKGVVLDSKWEYLRSEVEKVV